MQFISHLACRLRTMEEGIAARASRVGRLAAPATRADASRRECAVRTANNEEFYRERTAPIYLISPHVYNTHTLQDRRRLSSTLFFAAIEVQFNSSRRKATMASARSAIDLLLATMRYRLFYPFVSREKYRLIVISIDLSPPIDSSITP